MRAAKPLGRRTVLKSSALLAAWPLAAGAQGTPGWPAKQVSLVAGFPPGGSTDFVAREIAQRMTEVLGKPMVVENRPGANGLLAAVAVAGAPADGHTLLLASPGLATNPHLYSRNKLDPTREFTSISVLIFVPNVLVINPQIPASNLDELVRLGRSRSQPLRSATTGQAAPGHLASEMFKREANLPLEFIAYKGSGPALTDVVAGHVDMSMPSLLAALPLIRAGRLRAIALTGARRSELVPNLPTFGEGGYKELDRGSAWYGLFGPAGMPRPIVARLSNEAAAFMKLPEVRQRFAANGAEAVGMSAADTEAFVAQEYKRWGELIKAVGIKSDE